MAQDADLTVIIGNYNHARFLPRCLDTVLTQSVRPREVIVIDDASTDHSLQILEEYARRDPIIRLVRQERNQGVVATYNTGVHLARTRFMYLGGADDYVLPGFFEKSLAAIERNDDAGLCCGFDSHAYGYEGEIRRFPVNWSDRPRYFAPDEVARLVKRNISAQSTIVRRAAHMRIGMYRPELAWYSDWFAYLCIALRDGMVHIPESLAVRTLGLPGAYSSESLNWGTERHIRVLGELLNLILSPEFADVAPRFRRCGAVSIFGPDLIRAAVRRGDAWKPEVLGLLNGYTTEQYRSLLQDPEPQVREIAELFLGNGRCEEQDQHEVLCRELEMIRRELPPRGVFPKLTWLAGKLVRRTRRMLPGAPTSTGMEART